jgi:hypothetical protein
LDLFGELLAGELPAAFFDDAGRGPRLSVV